MKHKPWHILLIEDDADERADLRHMLIRGSDRQYHFTEAGFGAEALQKFRDQPDGPYDCIILDYFLPDMNGEDVLVALCGGGGSAGVPGSGGHGAV